MTGSYYAKTGFDFDDTTATTTVVVDADGDGLTDAAARSDTLFQTSGDRYEWDASGGIYIHPYVALLGGYKKVRQGIDSFLTQQTVDLATGATRTDSLRLHSDIDIEGPTIGIASSVPIGRGFGVYASYAHGFMDAKIRDVNLTTGTDDRAPIRTRLMMSRRPASLTPTGRRAWLLICPYLQRPSTPATDTRTSAPNSMSLSRTARTSPRALRSG